MTPEQSTQEWIQRNLRAIGGEPEKILRAMQVLGYTLVFIRKDEDGDSSWIVKYQSPSDRPHSVKTTDITEQWMLYVVAQDVNLISDVAIQLIWNEVERLTVDNDPR